MDVNKVMILVVFIIITVCSFTSDGSRSTTTDNDVDNSTLLLSSKEEEEEKEKEQYNGAASTSFTKKLSRKRRYLVFPEGSSFSVDIFFVIHFLCSCCMPIFMHTEKDGARHCLYHFVFCVHFRKNVLLKI